MADMPKSLYSSIAKPRRAMARKVIARHLGARHAAKAQCQQHNQHGNGERAQNGRLEQPSILRYVCRAFCLLCLMQQDSLASFTCQR